MRCGWVYFDLINELPGESVVVSNLTTQEDVEINQESAWDDKILLITAPVSAVICGQLSRGPLNKRRPVIRQISASWIRKGLKYN